MVFLLKLILWIFLIGVFAVLFIALRIGLTFRKMKRDIESHASPQQPQGTTTTSPTGERITDTRSPEQANRKIINDDEGEYVDFVEE
jgi:hypothetical protein